MGHSRLNIHTGYIDSVGSLRKQSCYVRARTIGVAVARLIQYVWGHYAAQFGGQIQRDPPSINSQFYGWKEPCSL